jgi:hypothetical protein
MLPSIFVVAIGLGIPISDPATWPGNAPPEYPITLPVKNEIRGFFELDHDAHGFMIRSRSSVKGANIVYRLRLTPAQRDQFHAFLSYGNFRPIGASEVTCLCDGIAMRDHIVRLRWANLFWVDPR